MDSAAGLYVGQRILCKRKNSQADKGYIRFIGSVHFDRRRDWIGVELDHPLGNHDGVVKTVRYFSAKSRHGIFIRPRSVFSLPTNTPKITKNASRPTSSSISCLSLGSPSLSLGSPSLSQASTPDSKSGYNRRQYLSFSPPAGGAYSRFSNLSSSPSSSFSSSSKPASEPSKRPFSRAGFHAVTGVRGLRNLGNTCFFNSVIQVLAHCPDIRERIKKRADGKTIDKSEGKERGNEISRGTEIEREFRKLVQELHSSGDSKQKIGHCDPSRLFRLLVLHVPVFGERRQQDALELYKHLLDLLESDGEPEKKSEESNSNSHPNNRQNVDGIDHPLDEDAHNLSFPKEPQRQLPVPVPIKIPELHVSQNYPKISSSGTEANFEKEGKSRESSPSTSSAIRRLFLGTLSSVVTCHRCRSSSETLQEFSELSLPIPAEKDQDINILECLRLFSSEEDISDYRCVTCSVRTSATKRLLIKRLPKVLVLHLKRYVQRRRIFHKLQTRVKLFATLNLGPFAASKLKISETPAKSQKLSTDVPNARDSGGDLREMRYEISKKELVKGTRVDCRDEVGKWLGAEILERGFDGTQEYVKIHFLGWDSKYDCKVSLYHELWRFARYESYASTVGVYHEWGSIVAGDIVEVYVTTPVPRRWVKARVDKVEKNQIRVEYKIHDSKLEPRNIYQYWFHGGSGEVRRQKPSTKYRLCGVVNHRGSLKGGHYTAYVPLPSASSGSDCTPSNESFKRWCCMSDSRVFAADLDEVLSSQAYLCVYSRMDECSS